MPEEKQDGTVNGVVQRKTAYEKREWLTAAVLLLLGWTVRLAFLGVLPYGLNQDEASAGYEAFALLTEGMDRCGNRWPVLLEAWGSGQNALLTYLAIPFVSLFGLSELSLRLPAAILACLSLPVFWRIARRCGGVRFGLLALGLLALNPWHIMMSRWGLESNLLPFFLLLGVWLAGLSREHPWALPGAGLAFGLSLYAYGTAFFFLPLFLILLSLRLRKCLKPAPYLTAMLLFLFVALPIGLCQLINALGLPEVSILGLTLPRLSQTRQAATSVFAGGGISGALENFRSFLSILWDGGDGLPYNAMPFRKGGLLYFFGLPTAVLGAIASLFLRKDREEEAPMRLWLLCGLVCAFLIQGNVNRLNMIWMPLVYFSAYGCALLLKPMKRWAVLPLAGVLLCFCVFLNAYTAQFGGSGNINYFPGLGAAVEMAEAMEPETVYLTDSVNQPYIFALFYTEYSPSEFAESVVYTDCNAAFRRVERFDGFEFRDPSRADILILAEWEASGYEILGRAGRYVICKGDA